MAFKFDDCRDCRFRRKPQICEDCDFGEQFESAEIQELSFADNQMFRRAEISLTDENDEPSCNPDDLIRRLDEQEEDEEDDNE